MIRITTQMLNESARKAGRPINSTSLLNYINVDSSKTSLADVLNKSKETAVDTAQKKKYTELEETAESLTDSANFFTKEKLEKILAGENGEYQDLYKGVKNLVSHYNDAMEALQEMSTTLNSFYGEMLKDMMVDKKETLSELGITISSDGTLKLDQEKLKNVSVETLQNASADLISIGEKVSFTAGRVADNAKVGADSYSSRYDASGRGYLSSNTGKYDFWG